MKLEERIKYLISEKKYNKALKLCRFEDLDYLKQIVTGYLEQGDIDAVMKKISRSYKFCNNRDLQYSIIKRLIKAGYTDEALEICERDKYAKDEDIKCKEAFIYFKMENYASALKICNNPVFKKSEKIQYIKILILSILKRHDEIRTICEDEAFEDSILIQYPHVELLEEEKEYEKALEICLKPSFNCSLPFVSKEKELKEKITEISNKEASDIEIEEIEAINDTPIVQTNELENDELSNPVTKKTEMFKKETSDIEIEEIEVINDTPIVQTNELEKDELSNPVTKKIEISNNETSNIKINEIEVVDITPMAKNIKLEQTVLPTQVAKKKKEKDYKVKVKTIYDSYEDDLIELGTYYLSLLLNLGEPSFDAYAAAIGTQMKIASEKRKLGYDTGKTLTHEEKQAIEDYEKFMKNRKRIISAIDNIKYLEGRPITETESLNKVLSLIGTYKKHYGNVDKTK